MEATAGSTGIAPLAVHSHGRIGHMWNLKHGPLDGAAHMDAAP
jgi:hypothetical protein